MSGRRAQFQNNINSLRIRNATNSDLDKVKIIDTQTGGVSKPAYWDQTFKQYGGRKQNHFFLVSELEGEVVGFIIGEVRAWEFGSPPCGWILGMGVKTEVQLHGIATQMLSVIKEYFKKAEVRKVRTMVSRSNRPILSFFRSQGMMAGPYIELEMDLAEELSNLPR